MEETGQTKQPFSQDAIIIPPIKKVLTEDLGKIFEMAICLLYNISYDGPYKYSMEEANKIKDIIINLLDAFPHNLKHTAKNGARYDYTGLDDPMVRLSAKTTKKDGKIAPQVVGQPSKKKFCEHFNLDPEAYNIDGIKTFIVENVKNMLSIYEECTFDCPTIYYNKNKNKVLFIKHIQSIDWSNQKIEFSHIKKNKLWGESSTISIGSVTIGEFQVHNHRDCIKFRWAFEKLLNIFQDCFEIRIL